MKRILVLLLALVMIAGVFPARAEAFEPEEMSPMRYQYTATIKANLTISSNGTATCSGTIEAELDTNKTSIKVCLQQKKNGVWTQIDSWSGTTSAKGTKGVAAGYSYRVVSYGVIKNASGTVLERPSDQSSVKAH